MKQRLADAGEPPGRSSVDSPADLLLVPDTRPEFGHEEGRAVDRSPPPTPRGRVDSGGGLRPAAAAAAANPAAVRASRHMLSFPDVLASLLVVSCPLV